MTRLILASKSAARREMLTGAGVAFDVRVADVDEDAAAGRYVARLQRRRAGLADERPSAVRAIDGVHEASAGIEGAAIDRHVSVNGRVERQITDGGAVEIKRGRLRGHGEFK